MLNDSFSSSTNVTIFPSIYPYKTRNSHLDVENVSCRFSLQDETELNKCTIVLNNHFSASATPATNLIHLWRVPSNTNLRSICQWICLRLDEGEKSNESLWSMNEKRICICIFYRKKILIVSLLAFQLATCIYFLRKRYLLDILEMLHEISLKNVKGSIRNKVAPNSVIKYPILKSKAKDE